MRFLGRSLVGLFLLAVTAGLLALAGDTIRGAVEASRSDEPRSRPARERVFAARVVTVTPETIRPVLSTFGAVRARRALEVRASSGGKVIELADVFEEGGLVEAGTVLVRIDPADALAALDTARADLAEAEADREGREAGGGADRLGGALVEADVAFRPPLGIHLEEPGEERVHREVPALHPVVEAAEEREVASMRCERLEQAGHPVVPAGRLREELGLVEPEQVADRDEAPGTGGGGSGSQRPARSEQRKRQRGEGRKGKGDAGPPQEEAAGELVG